jgi:hypothetical protein
MDLQQNGGMLKETEGVLSTNTSHLDNTVKGDAKRWSRYNKHAHLESYLEQML